MCIDDVGGVHNIMCSVKKKDMGKLPDTSTDLLWKSDPDLLIFTLSFTCPISSTMNQQRKELRHQGEASG